MTVVVRRDLKPGQQMAQALHAAFSFSVQNPDLTSDWHDISNYIVVLSVKDQDELKKLIQKCWDSKLIFTAFREPDLNNDFTAICIEPSDETARITSSLPLAFKEYPKDDIVFHFNKKHNEDKTIAPWVVKHKGDTHYVNHIDVKDGVSWSTKENPDNPHTKGSIRFKGNLELVTDNNSVTAKIK